MKTYSSVALGFLLITTAASAAGPQVEITARYENFGPAFFSEPPEGLPPGTLSAPRVTASSGQKATIEIIKEFPVASFTEPERKVSGGVTLEVEPEIKGGKIFLSGKSTVRRPETPAAPQPLAAQSFTARETFFSGEIEDGKSLTIQTGDGVKDVSKITLTVRQVPAGELEGVHTKAPEYSVWSVEVPSAEAVAALGKARGMQTTAAPASSTKTGMMGVIEPRQLAAVFRELPGKKLVKLPVADWPMTVAATLGPDHKTVDVNVRPKAEQPPALAFDCTVYYGSGLCVSVADAKQAGGQRTLLIVPQ